MGGRGGGSGRGRGSVSFNVEQLGLKAGEVLPGPVLQPPPLYPLLEFYPYNLETNDTHKEQVAFKTSLFNFLNGSSAFVQHDEVRKGLGNLTDTISNKGVSNCVQLNYDWSRFPPELMTTAKKKRKLVSSGKDFKKPNKVPRTQSTNMTSLLDELEKKEVKETDKEEGTAEKEVKKEDEEGEEDAEEFEEEDLDEEMDDGTDYNLNYFDNGEGYLDEEDDNLDDGPIY